MGELIYQCLRRLSVMKLRTDTVCGRGKHGLTDSTTQAIYVVLSMEIYQSKNMTVVSVKFVLCKKDNPMATRATLCQ